MGWLRRPGTRTLAGCVVGLVLLLGAVAGIEAIGPAHDARTATPLGPVSFLQLAGVTVSMLVAGIIAREGFRGIAVALVAAIGLASMVAAWMLAPEGMTGTAAWLARNHGAALVLEMAAAWLAAFAGERLARRRPVGAARG
jgi:hypothetical protein